MVRIPRNMHTGKETLEYEIPWMVPGAIILLDELLTKDMRVLEFGSGGSTLFFSRRAKSVLSYESVRGWYNRMLDIVRGRGISNVELVFYAGRDVDPVGPFDCILVDPLGDPRGWLVKKSIPLLTGPKILVLDNYGRFPFDAQDTKLLAQQYRGDSVVKTYNFPGYSGRGTRVIFDKDWVTIRKDMHKTVNSFVEFCTGRGRDVELCPDCGLIVRVECGVDVDCPSLNSSMFCTCEGG